MAGGGRGSRGADDGEIHIARNGDGGSGSRSSAQREIHIAGVATRQHGLVTRGQLLAAGLTSDGVDGRIAARRLHVVHPGVYSLGPVLAPSGREAAALLACGPGSLLSHATAAVVWELLPGCEGPVHVTTPRHRRGPAGVVVHRAAPERRRRRGLPVTAPVRTLLDLAAIDHPKLAAAVEEAQVRRLVQPERVLQAAAGRRGATGLRRILAVGPTPTRSDAERLLLRLVRLAGLPRPETNVRLHGCEVDALWRERRLVLEVDGYGAHGTRAAFERDRARDQRHAAEGHRVMRVTWRQLTERPEQVVAHLARAL